MDKNKRIDGIAARNAATEAVIAKYRSDAATRKVPRQELEYLIRDHPWFGMVPCSVQGLDFVMLHANDDIVARDYLWIGADGYEPETLKQWSTWCRKPGLVLDIGGYSGLMAIVAAHSNTENEVHMFEPLDRTIERASVNVKLNALFPRIKLHCLAASDADGEAQISLHYSDDFLSTGNAIEPKHDRAVKSTKTIRCVAIDSFMPDAAPTTVKIDVEGHELNTLRGMEGTLRRSMPNMIVEMWKPTRDEVFGFLDNLGYKWQRYEQYELDVSNYAVTPR